MLANLGKTAIQQTDRGHLWDCWIHSATRSGGSGKRCIRYNMTKAPPSRGGRIQSRMAPGMYHPCMNGRDTSRPRARGGLSPAAGSRGKAGLRALYSSPPAT